MANNIKTNPKGLDVVIQNMQNLLYNKLTALWNVDLSGYGRCYPSFNQEQNRKEIEFYNGANEYKDVLYAEENKFFFTAENEIERVGNSQFKTKIELFFIVNVSEIYPNVTHRADEEVRVDVINILEQSSFATISSIVIDIDKVFSKYEYVISDDLQPYHCFKIILDTLDYNINNQICN